MSKMFAPLFIDLSSSRHPTETRLIVLTQDDIEIGRIDATGLTTPRRIYASRGTAVTVPDIALIGNWGGSPSVFVDSGSNDTRGVVRITPDTGASGTLSWKLTFKDGAWASAPFVKVDRQNGAGQPAVVATTTDITVIHSGSFAVGTEIPYSWLTMG